MPSGFKAGVTGRIVLVQRFSGGPKHPHMAFATSQVANMPRNDLLEVLNMASTLLNTPRVSLL